METHKLDSLGSLSLVTPDGDIEIICWAHRGEGWEVRDNRGAGRITGSRTKRGALAIAKGWAAMKPSATFELTPLSYADLS